METVLMPQLGESVVEGTIQKWLVQAGDPVNVYDPLCEIVTDKVVAEVPSTQQGTIAEILVGEGETATVGAPICRIAPPGQSAAEASPKQRYSPAVVKLAEEYGLELSSIRGTGAGGRITRKDVMERIAGNERAAPVPAAASAPAPSAPREEADRRDEAVVTTPVRAAIARRMQQSRQETPHAWTMMECDVTNLVKYRNQVKESFARREGFKLTYLPFVLLAVASSLKAFPVLNSEWGGDRIIFKKSINLSVAVGTDEALYVPVIPDADQKNLLGIAKALNELAVKSRSGKLTSGDQSGGTFTVTNAGSFGSVLSMPIINPPQAAIMSVESIVRRPVVFDKDNESIAIRDLMNICLSFDHRILDGLAAGRFLQSVKTKLECFGAGAGLYEGM